MISPEQLLTILGELKSRLDGISTLDYVLPSPTDFEDKAGFWNCVAPKDTQLDIETTMIRAAWIQLLRIQSDNQEKHAPLYTLFFEIIIAHEHSYTRLDESENPDEFNKLVLKSRKEHDDAVVEAFAQFEGIVSIPGFGDDTVETIGLVQPEFTVNKTEFELVPGADFSVTRLESQVRARIGC